MTARAAGWELYYIRELYADEDKYSRKTINWLVLVVASVSKGSCSCCFKSTASRISTPNIIFVFSPYHDIISSIIATIPY
mmetsp:Transcript_1912/g.3704  ORF Transcript_1912/g.3704 Transcript_1912/m.3704 type:complete len:80 (-) Transcript_1912:135-374(-)